jgi:hypothetical protein
MSIFARDEKFLVISEETIDTIARHDPIKEEWREFLIVDEHNKPSDVLIYGGHILAILCESGGLTTIPTLPQREEPPHEIDDEETEAISRQYASLEVFSDPIEIYIANCPTRPRMLLSKIIFLDAPLRHLEFVVRHVALYFPDEQSAGAENASASQTSKKIDQSRLHLYDRYYIIGPQLLQRYVLSALGAIIPVEEQAHPKVKASNDSYFYDKENHTLYL